jgi:hypothetical protein
MLVPALLLGSCGQGGDESGAAGGAEESGAAQAVDDLDPCTLVTAAEAARALGVATAEADRPADGNTETRTPSYSGGDETVVRLKTCRYTGSRDQGVAVLTVMARHSSSAAEAETGFESMRSTYAESVGVTDVADVGDQAFWMESPPSLWLLRGQYQLSVSGDIDAATARALAAGALGRLNQ